MSVETESVYRVTVRGRFDGLDDKTRASLLLHHRDHDVFKSAYTTEGTFTYDERILFFNLRYEIKTLGGGEEAATIGMVEAERFLQTLGFGYTGLKVNVVDMSSMWSEN